MGAPRSAYADDDFVIVRGDAVRALGDYNTAGLFQRIAWRAERGGGTWRASMRQIADEVWLTSKQVRRSLDVLRERGWVDVERSGDLDQTHVYRVVWEEPGATAFALQGTVPAPEGTVDVPSGANVPLIETLSETVETPPVVPQGGPKPKGRATVRPEGYTPNATHQRLADESGVDLPSEFEAFCDFHDARGSVFKDWDAALRTWLRNAPKFGRSASPQYGRPAKPGPDERTRRIQQMGRELARAQAQAERAATDNALFGDMKGIEL